ncbi:MAG: hypothetical protein Q9M40_05690 [Sulfurimonas sp.]|nr:hypothetical protein [Sulfurimonas sp.]
MVKKLSRFLAYTLFFIFALMLFVPKTSLYYLLEEKLKEFHIVISKESLDETLFSLGVDNLEISVKEIEAGVVKEADIRLLVFYNSLSLKDIQLSSLVESYLPSKLQALEVTYTPFNPLVLSIEAEGEFGVLHAEYEILQNSISARLEPTNIMLAKV